MSSHPGLEATGDGGPMAGAEPRIRWHLKQPLASVFLYSINQSDLGAQIQSYGEGKGMTEDEMAGWHHRLDGHEFG